jgi:signal recognition particle GTPase
VSWFDRLKSGLGKTRDLVTLGATRRGDDWEMDWDDLELALVAADVGARLAAEVVAEAKGSASAAALPEVAGERAARPARARPDAPEAAAGRLRRSTWPAAWCRCAAR